MHQQTDGVVPSPLPVEQSVEDAASVTMTNW